MTLKDICMIYRDFECFSAEKYGYNTNISKVQRFNAYIQRMRSVYNEMQKFIDDNIIQIDDDDIDTSINTQERQKLNNSMMYYFEFRGRKAAAKNQQKGDNQNG